MTVFIVLIGISVLHCNYNNHCSTYLPNVSEEWMLVEKVKQILDVTKNSIGY